MYTGFAVYICFPFQHVIFFLNYCIIYSTTVFTAYPQHMHTVLFTITLPSRPTLLFTYASFSQYDIFSQLLPNWLYNNVYSISSTYTYGICLQLHYPVYWLCCLYMLPFHNVIFFHNHCPIHSTTMFTAYTQHIHTVLFTITLPSILYVLFTYASFSQCDIFSQSLHNWHYTNVYSISATYTYSTVYNYSPMYTGFAVYICFPFQHVIFFLNYCIIYSTTVFTAYPQHIHTVLFTITLPSRPTLLFTYASFSQYDIFSQLLPNWIYNNVYSISSTYTYGICLQLHYPVYWLCCLYMLPFHNVIFFHNHCPIHSTTMFTAYTQHIHTVLFTITQPSILYVLFTYASFSQCDIFSQSLYNWLYNNVYSISSTYAYSTVYNYTTQ